VGIPNTRTIFFVSTLQGYLVLPGLLFTFLSNLQALLREECSNNNATKGMKL